MASSKALGSLAASSLLRDLEDEKYCDFALMCQGVTIRAHKVVICPQSSVLAAACSQGKDFHLLPSAKKPAMERLVEYLYTGEYSYPAATAQHELETVSSDSPGIDEREIVSNFWPSYKELGTLNFVFHLDIIDVAKELAINNLATKAVEYFRKEVMEIPESLTFLKVVPFVFSMDGTGILLQNACIEATRSLFGPGLAVGEKKRQLLDNVFERVPAFSQRLLSSCLTIAAPSSKECRFSDSNEDAS